MTHMAARLVRVAGLVLVAALTAPATAADPKAGAADRELDFAGRILPILTRHGCNGGACHGAGGGAGQNGFYLSLFGFEPVKDHARITEAARGRFLDFAAPDESLLLQKPSGVYPHGGGIRLARDSKDYATLRAWIAAGAPLGDPQRYRLAAIEVEPAACRLATGAEARLTVTAVYAGGQREDVTAWARFESNDGGIAELEKGHGATVRAGSLPGDTAIVVLYRDKVATVPITIPRVGPAAPAFPAESNFVDRLAFAKLKAMNIAPSERCDDPAFLRRLMIDVAGRLPTIDEAATFLADTSPDKRDQLIDRVLDSGDYATTFADKWVVLLRSSRESAGRTATSTMHQWLRQAFQDNMPYDQFVREILTATGAPGESPAVGWWRSQASLVNGDFANNAAERVKDAAEDSAILFLGQRLACAKCHQHPFDRWSQADYHGYAAFFTQVGLKKPAGNSLARIVHRRGEARLAHPSTGEQLGPRPLGGAELLVTADEDPRVRLAAWMTADTNPFFAKAIVNRMWAHFFGRGFVDPEDDLRETNPPSNPQLLDALAADFVRSGYDLKHLVRTICRSTTYQLSSTPNDSNRDDTRNFSSHQPRRLKAEILLDAVDTVCGSTTAFRDQPAAARALELADNLSGTPFLEAFGRQRGAAACECGRNSASPNLGQSLQLINSDEVLRKVGAGGGRAKRLADSKGRPVGDRIEEVFLAAYARRPTGAEADKVRGYLERKELSVGAFEDLLWAVINSKEFLFTR
ncbi:S-layer protein [Planctomycetia bacterium]|nr:S-layer protein [Planctomycetia bacterium]